MNNLQMSRQDLISSIVLFGLLIILYIPILPDMCHVWFKYNNNSHGILVPFISLYLVWRKRSGIDFKKIHTSSLGLVIMVISLLLYYLGYAGGVEVLPRLTLVSTLIGLVIYNWGKHIFRQITFPLLFLFFMVPVPVSIVNQISIPLQLLVTKVSSSIISSLSISVLREGNILHFAHSSLEVAEACSGIRSLTAYIMLGFLFAYMLNGSFLRRSILILIAVPLAFFVNILRVTGTGILAHYYGSSMARGFLHEFSGMSVFVLGFIFLFVAFYLLKESEAGRMRQ